jgi:transmembrane sensor
MNTQFDELIAKHVNGTLREDEKQLLATLLKVPEHQLYLASKIDATFFDEDLKEDADDEIGIFIFQRIKDHVQQNRQDQVNFEDLDNDLSQAEVIPISWYKRGVVRWMAAASIILIVVSLVVLWNNKPDEPSIVVQNNHRTDSILSFVRHEVNTTGKERRLQLPDGSLIVLADKSEITYREPFTDKRDITLIGKADFKVAKDKTRPFTVISGDIATTALGTEFMVTAFAKAKQITVRLYEGQVVVRPVEKEDWRMKKDVFLSPGQELVYSQQALAYVRAFNKNNAVPEKISSKELSRDNPSIPEDTKGSWYMFNNQSLGQVLENLAAMYNVKIVYKKKDVQNINWTGKYNKSDSLETILKRIGTVHNLIVTKKDTAYIITK